MVFESIKIEWLKQRPYISLILGFCFVFLAYLSAYILGYITPALQDKISMVNLLFVTVLLIPLLIKLLAFEEEKESRDGTDNFISNHKDIIEIYLFLFLGVFMGYAALGFMVDQSSFDSLFSYQIDFLKNQQGLSNELIESFFEKPLSQNINQVIGLITNNLEVVLIFFGLSFFYGAGAVFLLALNASIFASFLVLVIRFISKQAISTLSLIGIFSIHLIPEISGFLLAAIAGGVVSKAITKEKFMSRNFKNVVRDAAILILLSCAFIVLAAFLEVYVSTSLIYRLF